jgi:hypothetical protein
MVFSAGQQGPSRALRWLGFGIIGVLLLTVGGFLVNRKIDDFMSPGYEGPAPKIRFVDEAIPGVDAAYPAKGPVLLEHDATSESYTTHVKGPQGAPQEAGSLLWPEADAVSPGGAYGYVERGYDMDVVSLADRKVIARLTGGATSAAWLDADRLLVGFQTKGHEGCGQGAFKVLDLKSRTQQPDPAVPGGLGSIVRAASGDKVILERQGKANIGCEGKRVDVLDLRSGATRELGAAWGVLAFARDSGTVWLNPTSAQGTTRVVTLDGTVKHEFPVGASIRAGAVDGRRVVYADVTPNAGKSEPSTFTKIPLRLAAEGVPTSGDATGPSFFDPHMPVGLPDGQRFLLGDQGWSYRPGEANLCTVSGTQINCAVLDKEPVGAPVGLIEDPLPWVKADGSVNVKPTAD